jgi:hypothetical protein
MISLRESARLAPPDCHLREGHAGQLRGRRISVSAGVLAVLAATVLSLGGAAYVRGRSLDPTERYFEEVGRPPSSGEGAMVANAQYALFSSDYNDVVFFGDSSCGNGVDPIRLRRLTDLQSYNIAIPGIGAQACPTALRGYLARHPKPKAVVLCLSPLGMEVDCDPMADALRRMLTYYGLELDDVLPLADSISYLVRSGARTALPHPDYRSLQLLDCDEPETYFNQQAEIFAARGFRGLPPRAGIAVPPAPSGVLIREDWDRGIHVMAGTCAAADVRMMILFSPIEAAYKHSRDFALLDRWGRELEKTHPGLTVARPIILPYEKRWMCDAIHLNSDGVEQFMPVVAKDVQALLAR